MTVTPGNHNGKVWSHLTLKDTILIVPNPTSSSAAGKRLVTATPIPKVKRVEIYSREKYHLRVSKGRSPFQNLLASMDLIHEIWRLWSKECGVCQGLWFSPVEAFVQEATPQDWECFLTRTQQYQNLCEGRRVT